jgi:hypothetical protein
MNGKGVALVPLALFALIGVWMVARPVAFRTWFKSARPDLKDNPDLTDLEGNPAATSFVKFLGIFFICITFVAFLALVVSR